jgi:hypothetical protein
MPQQDQHLTQPQVLSMLSRTQAHHNTGVPDYNLCFTPRLAYGAARMVHTTPATCSDTHKMEATSKPQKSVM